MFESAHVTGSARLAVTFVAIFASTRLRARTRLCADRRFGAATIFSFACINLYTGLAVTRIASLACAGVIAWCGVSANSIEATAVGPTVAVVDRLALFLA